MRKLKLQTPNYGGAADIELFDQFVFDFDNLVEIYSLDVKTALRVMPNYFFGKVHQYICDTIGVKSEGWNLNAIYTAIFEFCFLATFKEQLRRELMKAKQGSRTIEEFESELTTGARRFGDIPECTIISTLWDGAKQHICVFWRRKGLGPEYTSFKH
ncbi:hypothetical protein L218DRAFT_887448 [Marasmius fiardii PR-910]|nr:hypothetical protein L218DRAFT_887448 [Marasmius fiardii PR-910]